MGMFGTKPFYVILKDKAVYGSTVKQVPVSRQKFGSMKTQYLQMW